MLDFEDARPLMDLIRDYFHEHKKQPVTSISRLYYGNGYAGIRSWSLKQYDGAAPGDNQILWEHAGAAQFGDVTIDRYRLHHSRYLVMPLLHIHKTSSSKRQVLLWFGKDGKATANDWPGLMKLLDAGFDIVTFDFRGLGETRMPYKAISEDDPSLAQLDSEHAYVNPISGVLADYVYNSVLTGRPYVLQMIEDAEIAARFSRVKLQATDLVVASDSESYTLADAIATTIPDVRLLRQPGAEVMKWADLVEQRQELWPIQYLLPGGAFIHQDDAPVPRDR